MMVFVYRLMLSLALLTFAGAVFADPVVHRGGAIALKVVDFHAAREQVRAAAEREGGQVADVQVAVTEKGRRHGWIRVSVPQGRLAAFVAAVHGAGALYGEKLNTADRTSEYEELARRVERLQAHQGRLDSLLHSARRLRGSDILYVQERLFRAGVDEELLRQRRLDLERGAQGASVVVQLFEPLPITRSARVSRDLRAAFAGGMDSARLAWSRIIGRAATVAAFALAFLPLWLPALVASGLLVRVALRRVSRPR